MGVKVERLLSKTDRVKYYPKLWVIFGSFFVCRKIIRGPPKIQSILKTFRLI